MESTGGNWDSGVKSEGDQAMKKSLLSLAISAAIAIAPLPALAESAAASAQALSPKAVEATGPLAPGGAAGVQEAQALGVPLFWWLAGAAAVGAIIWVAVDSDDNDGSSSTD